ncbi:MULTISPECIES: RT0821/Lpp0805 family surface protein [unclassified Paraburkholderia]|uniref:RT0821/Lpp0805 family surface protein n=1 Tax=unclassified Paraburkholderia TaxID=2615204 RepID=UPI000E25B4C8|nr:MULTISPECIES: RT0821/Lpp0805 family surface protein [unclassified Paraburkholderia]REE17795.1 outer membrane surface antigen [Paraburkholderia sp. BL27I4N3]RKR44757.1 outer membrane surface antigen [Paraburkholderia sp. BL17N1]
MSMRIRVLSQLTAGSLLLGAAIGAQAANLGFLNDTPISYMKQRDIDSVKKAVFAALNDKQDGETANWVNEGTGNSVKIDAAITMTSTAKEGDRTCRDLGVVLSAKGQSMNLRPQFCKQGSGTWQLQKKH